MRAIIWLHQWLGAVLGIVLCVLALTGTLLLWEGAWIGLPGADDGPVRDPAALAMAVETARGHAPDLSRITFAGEEIGLHQAAYGDGSGAYFDASGHIVAEWSDIWGRLELWLFDIHHYLLSGEVGETIAGIAGLAGLIFVVTGAIIWWRTRKTFVFRLWPKRMTRSAIVRQHRDLGIMVAPVLAILFITGTAMIFKPVENIVTAPFAVPASAQQSSHTPIESGNAQALLAEAQRRFPGAEPRRLQFSDEGQTLRLRQPFEWTPNGRTYLREQDGIVTFDVPDGKLHRQTVSEKFYPLHSGKVGGAIWKLVLTIAGIALALLGALTTYSFWRARVSLA